MELLMEIYTILALLCVTTSASIFLGHAHGYQRGKRVGFKQGVHKALNDSYGKSLQRMNTQYAQHAKFFPVETDYKDSDSINKGRMP